MSSLKKRTQKALEDKGIPPEYASPAAEILATEITRTNRGEKVTRTSEQQEIISAAHSQIKR